MKSDLNQLPHFHSGAMCESVNYSRIELLSGSVIFLPLYNGYLLIAVFPMDELFNGYSSTHWTI